MTNTTETNFGVSPPSDEEKYIYIKGAQHRWFFWAHGAAFAGIAFSLVGFAMMTYWTLIFIIPLALYAAETLLGLRTSTFRRRVTEPDHRFKVETWQPEKYPSVDVFLPTAGEPLDILRNTYHYVSRLKYSGRVVVYVLDDMGRDEVRTSAKSYGFEYLARPGSEFKKAGNLRYGYEHSQGDHILILDADFVPRSDALTELVPYMDNTEVGIVQSPQYFATPNSKNWLERAAGATQEMWYRFIQVSRDSVDAAVCCGTSALYRRTALNKIGGFPQISHSEDVFTGIHMDKAGYRLQYVPVNVTQGICPDEINGFISQQYRWCEGSMELAKDAEFHLQPTLTQKQRLSFWSGFFYYATTAMNVFFAPLPILIMILLFPHFMRPENMLPLIGMMALWLVIYPAIMCSSWRLDVLRVQVIYGFAHAAAIVDVFFGKASEWVPSHGAAKATPLVARVKRTMAIYLGTMQLIVIGAFLWRLAQPEYTLTEWWAAGVFLIVNAYIFIPVVLVSLGVRAWPSLLSVISKKQRAAFGQLEDLIEENAA